MKLKKSSVTRQKQLLPMSVYYIFLQIRLDFSTFVISGPSTLTASVATGPTGKEVSFATQCLTDTFSLTGPIGSVPPVICGTNTGEHSTEVLSL
jgi:hypothetical protein